MTDLILRIFVRDHKNTEDPAVRDKCGRVAGAVGIVTNFLLFLMKIIVGTVFHSVSVTADARQQPHRFRLVRCHAHRL